MIRAARRVLDRFGDDEGGAALVEMTLITPFVLLLSAGVFEFSNIIHTRLLIESGLEDGARYIARCNSATAAQEAICKSQGVNLAVNGAATGGTARVAGWSAAQVSACFDFIPATGVTKYRVTYTPPLLANTEYCGGAQPTIGSINIYEVRVSLNNYNYTGTGLWGFLGFGALPMVASHQERVLGW